jgi:DNA-binding NtrC family response regulator
LRDEVPDIAAHLLTQLAESGEIPMRHFASGALNGLRQHPWPGGYGELRGAVKSLALACLGEEIALEEVQALLAPAGTESDLPPGLAPEVINLPLREAREAFERMYFDYHLKKDGGNMTRLAEKTGLERTHLYRKLKDLGLR